MKALPTITMMNLDRALKASIGLAKVGNYISTLNPLGRPTAFRTKRLMIKDSDSGKTDESMVNITMSDLPTNNSNLSQPTPKGLQQSQQLDAIYAKLDKSPPHSTPGHSQEVPHLSREL